MKSKEEKIRRKKMVKEWQIKQEVEINKNQKEIKKQKTGIALTLSLMKRKHKTILIFFLVYPILQLIFYLFFKKPIQLLYSIVIDSFAMSESQILIDHLILSLKVSVIGLIVVWLPLGISLKISKVYWF